MSNVSNADRVRTYITGLTQRPSPLI